MQIADIESRIQEIEQDIKRTEASLLRMQGGVIVLRELLGEMTDSANDKKRGVRSLHPTKDAAK